MNFREFVAKKYQSTNAIAMDKYNSRDAYIIFCNDADGRIPDIINALGKHGNCGHSFSIVIDPDSKEKETFGWDGDGSDRIDSIVRLNGKDADKDGKDAIINMLLNTLNSIYFQARDGAESDERRAEFQEPPLTKEEMRNIFDNIIHDANVCLQGCEFEDVNGISLGNIKGYCENTLQAMADGSINKSATWEDSLRHIKKIAEEASSPKKK